MTSCNVLSLSLFQYLGSFPVQAADTSGRAEFVRQRLLSMKEQLHHLEVAVLISVSGIDVRSTQGKVRVSCVYSTEDEDILCSQHALCPFVSFAWPFSGCMTFEILSRVSWSSSFVCFLFHSSFSLSCLRGRSLILLFQPVLQV